MTSQARGKILFVDDEPLVVEGLAKLLRKDFDIEVATRPADALKKVNEIADLAVVVSDMRMPGMDGAALLHEVRMRRPDVTRIVLTGEAGRDTATRAVNQGQIFRFLSKPCQTLELKEAIEAGIVQHRLVHSERDVLRETLIGCIGALMEVLAMANPVAFGRAERIKKMAMRCAAGLDCASFWQLEAAALLSQLGYVMIPEKLLEKMYRGEALDDAEKSKLASVPDVANTLLEHIPRLEPVIQILSALKWPDAALARLGDGTVGLGTRILGAVIEFESLFAAGTPREQIPTVMKPRASRFGEKVIEQLGVVREETARIDMHAAAGRQMLLRDVTPGMILKSELRNAAGALMVPREFTVTKTLLDRIASVAPEMMTVTVTVENAPG